MVPAVVYKVAKKELSNFCTYIVFRRTRGKYFVAKVCRSETNFGVVNALLNKEIKGLNCSFSCIVLTCVHILVG